MMSVVVILVLFETVRFLIKDKSETLSPICTPLARQDKDRNCFGFRQHSVGYCPV